MKKILLRTERRMMGAILLTISILSLQSCCFQFEEGIAKKKNCNCGRELTLTSSSEKKEIAQSPIVPPHNANVSSQHIAVGSNEENLLESNSISKKEGTGVKMISAKKPPLGIKAMNTHLVAGPSVSFMSNDDNGDSKSGVGFQAGIKTTFAFSNQFNVSTGLLVKKNAASETIKTTGEPGGGDPGMEYKSKYGFTYLSAPLMAEFKTGSGFTLMAGPELNLLLGASAKTSVNGNNEQKTDIKDQMVKTGIGIQAGVKYNFPRSPLMLQLVYDHRLSRLDKETTDYVAPGGGGGSGSDNKGSRMKSIQLGLGFSICDLLTGNFKY